MSRARLADYFAVVGFNFDSKNVGEDLVGDGKTLERYPTKDWPEFAFPESVALFCQPNGWRLRTKAELIRSPPTVCTTVFTDAVGTRAYGVFLTFYEPVEREHFQKPFFEAEVGDSGSRRQSVRFSELFAPKTFALLSQWPIFDCLKTSLCILYTAFVERKFEMLEVLVGNMLRWQGLEKDGTVRFKMGLGDIQPVQIPRCLTIPSSAGYSVELFHILGIKNVLTLFVALLCGERVLLVSRAHSRLFGAAQALVSLLYPFEYAYSVLPLVPAQLVPTLVDNPTPFVYGVHESLIPLIPDPVESFRSLVLVNLDTCSVTLPERSNDHSELPAIPDVLLAKLTDVLIRILQPDLARADNALSSDNILFRDAVDTTTINANLSNNRPHAENTEGRSRSVSQQRPTSSLPQQAPTSPTPVSLFATGSDAFLDKRIRAVFLRFFAELLIGYRSALIVVRVLPEPLITFDRVAFLAARKRLDSKFFETVLNSALFQMFIQQRGRPFRARDLFDDVYTSILDRLKQECSPFATGSRGVRRSSNCTEDSPGIAGGAGVWAIDLDSAPADSISLEYVDSIADRLHRNELGDAPGAHQLIRRIPPFTRNFSHSARFPALNAAKIEALVTESARFHTLSDSSNSNASASLPEVIEIGPNPEEYSGSAVLDRHEQRANVESRLAVLQRCIDYIFDRQISDALKVFPAVLGTLQTPRGRLALARKLKHKVEEKRSSDQKGGAAVKGKVDDAQFDLISRLLNVALRADSATDEFGVAYHIMPVARLIFKPLGSSHCQLFACKQVQDYPVWRSEQFWETALYKDIEEHLHREYGKRAENDKRFESFLKEVGSRLDRETQTNANWIEERRGEVLKLFTKLHRWRDVVLRLTAEVIKQRSKFSDEELRQLVEDEERLIWGHINAYIDTILDFLVPVRFTDLTSERDNDRRNAAARTVPRGGSIGDPLSGELHDIDNQLLFQEDPAARAIQVRAVRFIKQFIDRAHETLCGAASVADRDRAAQRDRITNPYRAKVDARVRAHMDTMIETRDALEKLPTVQPTRIVKPVLLVGEQIIAELRCYMLADARDVPLFDGDFVPSTLTAAFLERSNGTRSLTVNDFYDGEAGETGVRESEVQLDVVMRIEEKRPPIGDQSRPATAYLPAAGALFLTNYRVVFKGSPCEQIAACHTVSRAFAISALTFHKHAEPATLGFAHAPACSVHDVLHFRAATGAFVLRVAFDSSVSADAVREFREQLNALRKAKSLLTVFGVTANFGDCQLLDVAKGGIRALSHSDAVANAKQRTLMQRARKKATRMVTKPFKNKKASIREMLVPRMSDQDIFFARGAPAYASSISIVTSASTTQRHVLHTVDEAMAIGSDVEMDENETDAEAGDQRSATESETVGLGADLTLPTASCASVSNDDNSSIAASIANAAATPQTSAMVTTVDQSPSVSSSLMVTDPRWTATSTASGTISLPDGSSAFDPNFLLRMFYDEYSAYADYVRLGFTLQASASSHSGVQTLTQTPSAPSAAAAQPSAISLLKQAISPGANGPLASSLRLTLENARHSICASYPAVLIVPSSVSDDGLRKFAKTHAENRFPSVVWRHPRNHALLLRGSAFVGKSFTSVLKQAAPGYASVANVTPTSQDIPAGVTITRDAEQEKFFTALCNATPGMHDESHIADDDFVGSHQSFNECDANSGSRQRHNTRNREDEGHIATNFLIGTASRLIFSLASSEATSDTAATAAAEPETKSLSEVTLNPSAPSSSAAATPVAVQQPRSPATLSISALLEEAHTLTPIDSDDEEGSEHTLSQALTAEQKEAQPATQDASEQLPKTVVTKSAPTSPLGRDVQSRLYASGLSYTHSTHTSRNLSDPGDPQSSTSSSVRTQVPHTTQQRIKKYYSFSSAAVKRAISLRRTAQRSKHVTWPTRAAGELGTPTLPARGADFSTVGLPSEMVAANVARSIAQRVSQAKVYVLIDKDAKQPSRADSFICCEFIEVEHHDARELREAYQRLMDACSPLTASQNGNDDETFLSRVGDSGWLKQVQNVLRIAGLVVDLLDAQGSSVVLCLESGWEVTAQVVSVAELLLDPFYRTVRGFSVLVEKEWLAFGHRFSHRHRQMTLDAAIAPFFLQFLDCVNQIREQFPLSFEFNEYFLRFIAHHAFSSRFVDFLYDSEAQREASGLIFARQNTELPSARDSFVVDSTLTRDRLDAKQSRGGSSSSSSQPPNDDPKNPTGPVYASHFVRFSSIWRYLDYYNQQSPIFWNCQYDAKRWADSTFYEEAVLRPQTSIPRLSIWNYFTEQDMYVGASLYDPELSCVELLNSFSAQSAADDSVYLVPEDLERAFGLRTANEDEMIGVGVGAVTGAVGATTDPVGPSGGISASTSTQKVQSGPSTAAAQKVQSMKTTVTVKDEQPTAVALRSISRKPEFSTTTATAKQRIAVQLAYESSASAVPSAFALLHLLAQWRNMMDRHATTEGEDAEAEEAVRSTFLAETASQVNKGRLLPLPRCAAVALPRALAETRSLQTTSATTSSSSMSRPCSCASSMIRPIWAEWLVDRHSVLLHLQPAAVSPVDVISMVLSGVDLSFTQVVSHRAHQLDSIALIVQAVHRSGSAGLKEKDVLRGRLFTELHSLFTIAHAAAATAASPASPADSSPQNGAVRVESDHDVRKNTDSQPALSKAAQPAGATTPSASRNTASQNAPTQPPPVPSRPTPGALTLANMRTSFGSYLLKQGQVFRKWERHYFVLDLNKRAIWQYNSREELQQEQRSSEKWIDLTDLTNVHILDEVRNAPRNAVRGAFFSLNTKYRTYSFMADDAATARDWVNRLKSHISPSHSSSA